MKKIYLISIILFFTFSCNQKASETTEKVKYLSSGYCENELNLLNSFDTIPTFKNDFQFIYDSLEYKVCNLFTGDICCKDLYFNIIHHIDTLETIKISLKFHNQCDDCPDLLIARHDCVILQNSKGQVLFRGHLIDLDSLNNKIVNYYLNVGKKEFYPDTYGRVNIALHWDDDVSKDNFSKFINQIIKGYLDFVNKISKRKYKKEVCELNKIELLEISKDIPLNIELPIFEIVEVDDELKIEK